MCGFSQLIKAIVYVIIVLVLVLDVFFFVTPPNFRLWGFRRESSVTMMVAVAGVGSSAAIVGPEHEGVARRPKTVVGGISVIASTSLFARLIEHALRMTSHEAFTHIHLTYTKMLRTTECYDV